MENIDLTFGIPVYNAEKYIKELLNCFKEESDFKYEVIIIDDGSIDNSYKICKQYKNSIYKILHHKNRGVSYTRNRIIEEAKGKWITFIDADDLIDFDKYKTIFLKIKDNNSDFYIGINDNKVFNSKKKKLSYIIENEIINSPINRFYKTEILKNNNIKFDIRFSLGEDLLFNLKYTKQVKKIDFYFSDDMYIIRNINNESLTHKYRNDKYEELMSVNAECKAIFKNNINILKSLEYIRIKNCISCVKDYYIFDDIYDKHRIKSIIKKMKKEYNRKYILLNNVRSTIIYNLWYLSSPILLMYIIKKYTKKREVFR